MEFTYQPLAGRVVFRSGGFAALSEEVARLGRRALVLSTPEQRDLACRAAALLGGDAVGIFSDAVMHVPVETVAAARAEFTRLDADLCVAVGGGSTVGLAKALALAFGCPIVAVPTTYAGSEMTPIWGVTEAGMKTTGRDLKVVPRTVIYDPELTLTLPANLSVTSGINAIAHCVEALYAQDTNPILQLMAEEGIRALAFSLPIIARRAGDVPARAQALYGAWLAGACLGSAGVALHHKLCHVLGGTFNLPHAETHTVILPHAVAYNYHAAPEAMRRLATALGAEYAPRALFDLAKASGAPVSLREIGMPEAGLERALTLALSNPYWNPAPVVPAQIRALLVDAYAGKRPGATQGP